MARHLRIEVVYALPGRLDAVTLQVEEGTTAGQALEASGLLARHREVDLRRLPIGIYGRRVDAGQMLCDGDRVEVYRRLLLDPKDARRARAARRAR